MARFIRDDLASARYKGVESIEALADELGIAVSSIIKLNANENQYGVPEACAAAMSAAINVTTHVYPDPSQAKLRGAVAELHELGPESVVAGAGSDDILDIILRATAPKIVAYAPPTFGMYSFLAKVNGSIEQVLIERTPEFGVTAASVIASVSEALADGGHGVVFLPSPNNPTGNLVALGEVRAMCAALPNAIIVLDEAYIDFAPAGASAAGLIGEYDNLVVCRTFSKWAGLAGTRIGYCLADPQLVATFLAIKQPYNVNCAAEAGALAALGARDDILASSVSRLIVERRNVFVQLAALAPLVVPVPSSANFVLARIADTAPLTAGELASALRAAGILIRYFNKQGGDLEAYIRISAGKPADTAVVIGKIRELLGAAPAPPPVLANPGIEAVLFDMDGVLADVGASYRAAIVATAKAFGVTVTATDIDAAKAAGNANNDWLVTRALIAASDDAPQPLPTLDEVTCQFEALYHGDGSTRGLYANETLVVAADLLHSLKHVAGLKLAVVTGRPRDPDATRFLDDFGLTGLFDAVITMDDGPAKPSPVPIQLALDALGVAPSAAIMLGDTVDDVAAALAASVPALGVIPPGAGEPDGLAKVLTLAGASYVMGPGCFELAHLITR
ncbi:histidinol-phosphate aminotransferase [Thecamonas trahens ATCC 50062]|uniref:histidinol-phosphate transaminase n=1 Tax=Thecamonas trahens ATCC 50062 TaxID=461836 RepID=A0A0L0D9P2_THETB|nr:histidinol-phosphate aminotransferase [Thecamonas trahens ATCC 50062]KNC48801.1 histidinol-phosphate aminotransferase [Thecamonas trahens ATCC 50062]|eukprot:XP_013762852.1 histidinol-phosphate aminotransferase [Thecamonas trahens ATCC 50062]